jgi:hypothetical protein
MKLSEEKLDEFIEIYHRKHGVVLDRQDAYDKAIRLMRLVELVESNTYKHDKPTAKD